MKKIVLIAAIALALPFVAAAQPAAADKPAAKTATKSAAKPAAKTAAHKAPARKRQVTRRAAKAVEEVTPISDEAKLTLTDADLAVAKRVYTGKAQCELGADVTVVEDDKKPGFFNLSTKGAKYRMHPVESRTGAIRLEDPAAGAMWLQLGNKSMLMSQKLGLRLADECQTADQVAFAAELKNHPQKSLFDNSSDAAPASK
jgi:Ni/Co efflux regulator RcnB